MTLISTFFTENIDLFFFLCTPKNLSAYKNFVQLLETNIFFFFCLMYSVIQWYVVLISKEHDHIIRISWWAKHVMNVNCHCFHTIHEVNLSDYKPVGLSFFLLLLFYDQWYKQYEYTKQYTSHQSNHTRKVTTKQDGRHTCAKQPENDAVIQTRYTIRILSYN